MALPKDSISRRGRQQPGSAQPLSALGSCLRDKAPGGLTRLSPVAVETTVRSTSAGVRGDLGLSQAPFLIDWTSDLPSLILSLLTSEMGLGGLPGANEETRGEGSAEGLACSRHSDTEAAVSLLAAVIMPATVLLTSKLCFLVPPWVVVARSCWV